MYLNYLLVNLQLVAKVQSSEEVHEAKQPVRNKENDLRQVVDVTHELVLIDEETYLSCIDTLVVVDFQVLQGVVGLREEWEQVEDHWSCDHYHENNNELVLATQFQKCHHHHWEDNEAVAEYGKPLHPIEPNAEVLCCWVMQVVVAFMSEKDFHLLNIIIHINQ